MGPLLSASQRLFVDEADWTTDGRTAQREREKKRESTRSERGKAGAKMQYAKRNLVWMTVAISI